MPRLGRGFPAHMLLGTIVQPGPAIDAVGSVGTGGSCTITPTVGTTVYAGVVSAATGHPVTAITYAGSAMTLVTSLNNNNTGAGITYIYKMVNVAAGLATISVTFSGGVQSVVSCASYSRVVSESVLSTNFGSSTSPSIGPFTPSQGNTLFCVIGANKNISSTSGGAQQVLANNSTNVGFAMLDARSGATTFGATLGASAAWAGIVLNLV